MTACKEPHQDVLYDAFAAKVALARTLNQFRFAGGNVFITLKRVDGRVQLTAGYSATNMAAALNDNPEFLHLARSLTESS